MSRPVKSVRVFDHFPDSAVCPLCGTTDDGPTVLLPIPGTEKDGLIACNPAHVACAVNLIYALHEVRMTGRPTAGDFKK